MRDAKAVLTQTELARALGVSSSQVSQWTNRGMPRDDRGRYDGRDCVAWLMSQRLWIFRSMKTPETKPGRGPTSSEGSGGTWADEDEKYKALARRQRFEREAGLLIYKVDADKDYMRIVLSLRASLLALPEQIAPQLADLSAREAAAVLRERMHWLCSQYRDGRVPITPAIEKEIDEIVERYVKAMPAPASTSIVSKEDSDE